MEACKHCDKKPERLIIFKKANENEEFGLCFECTMKYVNNKDHNRARAVRVIERE